MTSECLTQEERDRLTVAQLVEHDLRHSTRGRGVSVDAHRKLIGARVQRERRQRKQDAADLALAEQAGTTVAAIRQARAERAKEEARILATARLDVARLALDGATEEHIGLEVTRGQIEAVRDSLTAAGKYHGYGTLATYFDVSPDTIRRRLGRRS